MFCGVAKGEKCFHWMKNHVENISQSSTGYDHLHSLQLICIKMLRLWEMY